MLKLEFGLQTVVAVPRPTSDGLLSFRGALAARDDRIAALDKLLIDRQERSLRTWQDDTIMYAGAFCCGGF